MKLQSPALQLAYGWKNNYYESHTSSVGKRSMERQLSDISELMSETKSTIKMLNAPEKVLRQGDEM